RRQRIAEEIGVTGRVEQMDADFVAVGLDRKAGDGELERVLQFLLERGVVADGSAALDAAGRGDRPRLREQRLGEAGLAATGLADERNRPDAFDGICHGPCLLGLFYRPENGVRSTFPPAYIVADREQHAYGPGNRRP